MGVTRTLVDAAMAPSREANIAELVRLRDELGFLPGSLVAKVARRHTLSERTVLRDVARRHAPACRAAPKTAMSDELLRLFVAERGCVLCIHKRLLAAGTADRSARSLARTYRQHLTPAERAMIKSGVREQRRFLVYFRWEAAHRNDVWEVDSWEAPVWVRSPSGRKATKPWFVTVIDAYSRAIPGLAIGPGAPSQSQVLFALHEAARRDRGSPFWGAPLLVRFDHGLEYTAQAVQRAVVDLGSTAKAVEAYHPHRKGKIERLNWTFEQLFVSKLPNYLRGPRGASGVRYDAAQPLLSFDEFVVQARRFVAYYNDEHRHSALGGASPRAAYEADPYPQREVPEERLRGLLEVRETRKILTSGISCGGKNRFFYADELNGMAGEKVEIRYCTYDYQRIDVYYRGDFLCTAYPQGTFSERERTESLRHKARQERTVKALVRKDPRERSRDWSPVGLTGEATPRLTRPPALEAARREERATIVEDARRRRARSSLLMDESRLYQPALSHGASS